MGSDRQRDPTGTAADDQGIGDDQASATILAAGKEATAHVKVAGHTTVAVEPLPWSCIVRRWKGEGRRTQRG